MTLMSAAVAIPALVPMHRRCLARRSVRAYDATHCVAGAGEVDHGPVGTHEVVTGRQERELYDGHHVASRRRRDGATCAIREVAVGGPDDGPASVTRSRPAMPRSATRRRHLRRRPPGRASHQAARPRPARPTPVSSATSRERRCSRRDPWPRHQGVLSRDSVHGGYRTERRRHEIQRFALAWQGRAHSYPPDAPVP